MINLRSMALLAMLLTGRSWGLDLFISGSEGYTHYDAKDFNRVLTMMENTTQEKGFNPYAVNNFDGHPQNSLLLGVRSGNWSLGAEAEFWVESFEQAEVPFDLEEAERNYRITCADLRDPNRTSTKLFGCVEAKEIFDFLPITLQLAYHRDVGNHFRVGAGYGLGVLAGSAHIEMTAKYYGADSIPNDHIRFQIWPGINPVQKAFVDLEYLPLKLVGLDWRTGWRISKVEGLTLRNQEGKSQIFSTVFPDAKNGAHMYFESFTQDPGGDQIYEGTEEEAKAIVALDLDVVGLQEVLKLSRDGQVINDFLPELLADIQALGGPDYQAFGIPLNDTALNGKQGATTITIAIHEGNALLVKPGLQILDSAHFIYFTLLPITTTNGKPTQRSLGYVKLKSPRGIVWQVFTSHLEVFAEISSSQAKEMRLLIDSVAIKDSLGNVAVPEVVLGDFNVLPTESAHSIMTEGGFVDLYIPKADSGYSCCVAGSALWAPDTTFSNRRIYFIFAKHLVKVLDHEVALSGAVISDSGQRILATDHRMVWTQVVGQ